jgi:hypothetical protein
MRTRLSGGVAGVEGETLPPYADLEPNGRSGRGFVTGQLAQVVFQVADVVRKHKRER